ncbi:MFS transporter [Allobranchiibius huperziae]|uniref:MFS family permease n=1 Tax=Allobranchiibius huperziae TaxID=1874116 RepID=A0A853D9Q7_9MICO|nr:MFS transporter [Allobranchiibius huperziae]NYJ73327.1 MFS family permease [Allobranchiibius huperziae]
MASSSAASPAARSAPRTGNPLVHRQLAKYPATGQRIAYLAITVAATVVLYYELYIPGAVATQIITSFNISFNQFVFISVIGNLVGAFGSLAAGLADRWGRANLVVVGLFLTGLLVTFALPHAPNGTVYLLEFAVLSLVEGMILVATPALIRDFSPQLGRASAMGFWTLGPVLGSLMVTEVSSHTLGSHPDWQFQFYVCGIVGLVVAVIALLFLRELSPGLRDQLMVSMRDRQLIEARAADVDETQVHQGQWRQMMKLDVVGSAFAISIFLIFYYIAVGFFVVYFATIFGYTPERANSLANWYWLPNAIALVVAGFISDKLGVRKPLMIVGSVISVIALVVFAMKATSSGTSYETFRTLLIIISASQGMTYCAWMASFTETVEKHNPAATATGLATWGWTLRIIVCLTLIGFGAALPATSVLVDKGAKVQELAAEYKTQLGTVKGITPANLAALEKDPTSPSAGAAAVGDLVKSGAAKSPADAVAQLKYLGAHPIKAADSAFLQKNGDKVQKAAKDSPGQWKRWWLICALADLLFIPFVFLMVGRWSPRKAREDAARHEEFVQAEMAKLEGARTA